MRSQKYFLLRIGWGEGGRRPDEVPQAGCVVQFETSKPLTSILSPFGGERKLPPTGCGVVLNREPRQPRERFSLSSPNEERAGVRSQSFSICAIILIRFIVRHGRQIDPH